MQDYEILFMSLKLKTHNVLVIKYMTCDINIFKSSTQSDYLTIHYLCIHTWNKTHQTKHMKQNASNKTSIHVLN